MTRKQHRDAFVIEEVSGPRFELTIERFRAGEAFEFRDVAFRLGGDGVLLCIIDSSWNGDGITSVTAGKDLDEGRIALKYLLESSVAFAAAARGRPVRYDLIEDYGNGNILIYSKINELVTWSYGFPRE